MKKLSIFTAAAILIAMLAAAVLAWMTRYEYRAGSNSCIVRIDRWSSNVFLGCPWKDWIPIGKTLSASKFFGNSDVGLKPFHGTLNQPKEASGNPVPQNATDDELMKVFEAPAAAASSAQQIREAAAEEARSAAEEARKAAAAAAEEALRATER